MRVLLIIIFFTISLFSSSNLKAQAVKTYEAEWKKIDELITKKNLPQSALQEVRKIYLKAKAEKQDAQVIKALVYISGLQDQIREDNQLLSIKEVEAEIRASKEPVVSILKSLQAQLYWNYFRQHRYLLYNRTATVNFIKDDPSTWTIEDFHRKISQLYLESISEEELLKKTKLSPFEAIIIKGNVRSLRPTLYDLLAHRALEYFRNDEREIKKPAYAFEISQPQAFAPAVDFVKYKFNTRDSLSLQHKALLVYQELIAFHLNDAKPDALIDVDLERISFVYENSVSEEKDSLYLFSLRKLIDKYGRHPSVNQARFLLAQWYNEQANSYDPLKDSTSRYDRIKARDILREVVRDSAEKNQGWINSWYLLEEIETPQLSFEIEKVNLPSQAFRTLVKYKNTTMVHFRIVKSTEAIKKELEKRVDDDFYWNYLLRQKPLRSWSQQLPQTNDLQLHSVEVKIDELPVGEYYLLASTDAEPRKESRVASGNFHVSNISYLAQQNRFFILHRETGQPLFNANVQVYKRLYDYKTSGYVKSKIGTYTTDKNGFFSIDLKERDRYEAYMLDISHGNDRLFTDDQIYGGYYYDNREDKQVSTKIFFFTDRSIYRPGQEVYFKGIVVRQQGDKNEIVPGYTTTLYLKDVNYQNRDSLEVTANEFGSFQGKFHLPQGILNGAFQIVDKKEVNRTSFSVEDYKRPKFYVEFEKLKETYKVGDTVTVRGNAKAYAGNNVSGANVTYRVVRQSRFLYPWIWRIWPPRTETMEIAHGETTTDGDGNFVVRFTAIPDKKIDMKMDPVFDYRIYADITDINGETRSGESVVRAGYKSLIIQTIIPEKISLDSFNKIMVRTENMNGEFHPALVTLNLHQLLPEKRLVRERYWQQPDQFVMGREEFLQYFPHDEYRNESDFTTWPVGQLVFTSTDSTKQNGEWTINNKPGAGFYKLEFITRDEDGKEVKDVRYMELYDPSDPSFIKPVYMWAQGSKPVEPGETAKVSLGSSANNLFVVHEVDKKGEDGDVINFTSINNEKRVFEYPVTEKDRGGFRVNYFFVKDNRVYQFSNLVFVPWTNKELNIEFATFRDKTLPGSEEKWKVKIRGSKNEQIAAEMLASMYDASLDQFRMHEWQIPSVWPNYYSQKFWRGEQNFVSVNSMERPVMDRRVIKSEEKIYDRLKFHIYEHDYRGYNNELEMSDGQARLMILQKGAPPSVGQEVAVAAGLMDATTTDTTSTAPVSSVEPAGEGFQLRTNFKETAFFFSDLRTDAEGNIEFSFTAPEALTRWKLQTLAHTKELAFGYGQKSLITQKELMVMPNAPRFLRQGDHIELPVKIANISDQEFTGQVQLQLFDAVNNQPVDGWFMNVFPNQYFTVAAGGSEVVKFPLQVPQQFTSTLTWRVIARAGNLSDGEENILPVLSSRILVTETLPISVQGAGRREYKFEKLVQSGASNTLVHQSLTVEYTSNPAWYAVQALPYLMEYPYDCAEQVWNRYYANALATHIVNSAPRIRQIFEQWKTLDTSALLSNLEKNQELKSALLEETPWVLEAQSETQQKKNIALLFDLVRMASVLETSREQLKNMQSPNGGFVWFKGGPDDRYITQYIITGIGHLKKLGVSINNLQGILNTAIPYLDKKISEDYQKLLKRKADLKKQMIGHTETQYLYMRSFFPEKAIPQASKTAYNFYKAQAKQFWMKQNKFIQGMTALALHRTGERVIVADILNSLKETSIVHEELGRYWKDNQFGLSWYWWQAPIETHSLLIEVFSEAGRDIKTVDELKTWLIRNKHTNNWRTTKATADACYAMLLQGTDWLVNEPSVEIRLGNQVVSSETLKTEAGTGYFKKTFKGTEVQPSMGMISLTVKSNNTGDQRNLPVGRPTTSNQQPVTNNPQPSWGAVYWQYFEEMDKVTTASTPLSLKKKLFIEKNTDRGPVLTPVDEGTTLHVGDKIKVRIELRVDREMDYVHMKDLRASALEPVNVISGYNWQGGVGYYQSTRDASTNFFFDQLRRGTYVFEYALFVSHTGTFNNGITTIQCMYAPEFSAHSEGVKISVE